MGVEHIKQRPQTPLSAEQLSTFLKVAQIGVDWVAGKLTIEQVQQKFGTLSSSRIGTSTTYFYKQDGIFGAVFDIDRDSKSSEVGIGRRFKVEPVSWKSASIPREDLEQRLGLHRVRVGELIDGVRKEALAYEARPILSTQDPDRLRLNLRLPLSDDSPFDVRAILVYRADLPVFLRPLRSSNNGLG